MNRAYPWIAALIHAGLLLGMLAPKPFEPFPAPNEQRASGWSFGTSMMVAGRDIHHDNLGLFLLAADLPVIVVASPLHVTVRGVVSPVAASYALAGFWLFGGSAWWFLVAWIFGKLLQRVHARRA